MQTQTFLQPNHRRRSMAHTYDVIYLHQNKGPVHTLKTQTCIDIYKTAYIHLLNETS